MTDIDRAYGYALVETGRPLERLDLTDLDPGDDEVIVEVAGCGVCHTDIGFAVDGVPTRHDFPLVLGHEISGTVVAAGKDAASWAGRNVIVPAVIPCGGCRMCKGGKPTSCARQFMPGNDGHGGFATHVKVPARGLCPVPDELPAGVSFADLSVVADAVTTPYEAIHRCGLTEGDVAVVVGAGGVGGFGVQIAAAKGAAVVAIDIDSSRLDRLSDHGASLTLNPTETDFREMKGAIRKFAKERGTRPGIKVFETSGTPAGQQTAFGLLGPAGHLAVVGFTPKKIEIRLSNLMAFDATAEGNWGCSPEHYPAALDLVLEGKVKLGPFVEHHSLDDAPSVVEAVASHSASGRPVLIPSA